MARDPGATEAILAKFLMGPQLTKEIKRICLGQDLRIAAAYWGWGAVDNLGLRDHAARIVCEIGAGATHPQELVKLRDLLGDSARYTRDLHAKVYLSDRGLVVGSANPSQNGIGFTGPARLIEAGILLGPGPGPHEDASAEFERLFESASPIDDKAIKIATELWLKDRKDGPKEDPDDKVANLLNMFRVTPSLFKGVGVVATNTPSITPEEAIQIVESQAAENVELLVGAIRKETLFLFSNWREKQISRWPKSFVHLDRVGRDDYRVTLQQSHTALQTALLISYEDKIIGGRHFAGRDGLTLRDEEFDELELILGPESHIAWKNGDVGRVYPNVSAFLRATKL